LTGDTTRLTNDPTFYKQSVGGPRVVPWATRVASRNPSRRHPTNLRLCRAAAEARLRRNPGGRARMVAAGLWSFLRCVGFEEEEGRSQQG
jgi:hypothetical protein